MCVGLLSLDVNNAHRYYQSIIKSFGDKEAEKIADGYFSKRLPPSNRLESLKGDRAGQWSIRINDQWRICFEWRNGDAYNIEIVDYH